MPRAACGSAVHDRNSRLIAEVVSSVSDARRGDVESRSNYVIRIGRPGTGVEKLIGPVKAELPESPRNRYAIYIRVTTRRNKGIGTISRLKKPRRRLDGHDSRVS